MISGFEILENWNFFRAIAAIPQAVLLFASLWFLGRCFTNKFLITSNSPLIGGVGFSFSLILICLIFFVLSVFGLLSRTILISSLFVLMPIGIFCILQFNSSVRKVFEGIKIRTSLLSLILSGCLLVLSFSVALLPTTKMDEISYHMLIPLRVINDGAILPYPFPWEASILPQLVYQLIFTPFFLLGFAEVANVFSLLVFIYAAFLMHRLCEVIFNIKIPIIFTTLVFFSGLFVVVDIITISSSAIAILGSVISFGTLIYVANQTCPLTRSLSFSLGVGLLILAFSKITMLPIICLSWFLYCYWIFKTSKEVSKLQNIILSGVIPLLAYCLVLILTYYIYGSPFGSMFGEFFGSNFVIYDPFVESAGAVLKISEIAFLGVTKFNLSIWILTFVLSLFLLRTKYRFLLALFAAQFLVIYFFLPERPRHFQGIQLVLSSFTLTIIISKIPKILKLFKFLATSGTALYTSLIFYYTLPLISMGYFSPKDDFLTKYIPYYKNFAELNSILHDDVRMVVRGSRINLYHLPRPLLGPFEEQNNCIVHFVVGKEKPQDDFELLYSDNKAVQYTYRTPNKAPSRDQLRLYGTKNSCTYFLR